MYIVTYADENVKWYVPYMKKACEKIGHELVVYTPETANFDSKILELKKESQFTKSPYKQQVILQALDELQEPVVWMDTDAFPIKPLDFPKCDAFFTLRTKSNALIEMWDGLINAGVSYHANTLESRNLLKEIANTVPKTQIKSDQEAINTVLVKRGWNKGFGEYDLGAKVVVGSTDEWNCFELDKADEAKVLHFKSPIKDKYVEFYNKYV